MRSYTSIKRGLPEKIFEFEFFYSTLKLDIIKNFKGENKMKIFKFLTVMITCLFLTSNLFAYMRSIDTLNNFRDMDISTMCIDNYKFVIVQENVTNGSAAVAIEQIYEVSKDEKSSVPAKC